MEEGREGAAVARHRAAFSTAERQIIRKYLFGSGQARRAPGEISREPMGWKTHRSWGLAPALPSANRALPFLEVSFRKASLSTWLGYHLLCPHTPDALLLFLFQSTDPLQTPSGTPIDMNHRA